MNNIKIIKNFLKEAKEIEIKKGKTYTLGGDIGKFKKGEQVKIIDKKMSGADYVITLENDKGVKDNFYLDKGDDFDELLENKSSYKLLDILLEAIEEKKISTQEAVTLIKNTKGKFFTVQFTKKDGTERVMNARLGVKAYLKGGSLPYDPIEKGLLPVYDVKTKGYRMININSISKLKVGEEVYLVQ
jgi:hypothetical protein